MDQNIDSTANGSAYADPSNPAQEEQQATREPAKVGSAELVQEDQQVQMVLTEVGSKKFALEEQQAANGRTEVRPPDAPEDEEQFIKDLAALWQSRNQLDLEVRWIMGKRLNDRLGGPDQRQAHGEQTIKKLSKEVDIRESDISRMRNFASLFESVEVFRKMHPNDNTWTKVKALLPRAAATRSGLEGWAAKSSSNGEQSSPEDAGGRSPGGKAGEQAPAEKENVKIFLDTFKSVRALAKQLRQTKGNLDEKIRDQGVKAIKQLVDAAAKRLGIRVTIELLGDVPAPTSR